MVKRIFYFSLILVFGIAITFVACSDENNVKNEQNELNADFLSARQKSFNQTIAKIQQMYPENAKLESRSDQVNYSSLLTCGADNDQSVNCVGATTFTITLPIPGNNKIYHPSLPPFECDFSVTMDIKFCQSSNANNSVAIFSNFNYTFASPISQSCWNWLLAWSQLPLQTRLEIRTQIEDDLEPQFETAFMTLWASDPNNNFSPCPPNNMPCPLDYHAVKANYYKASCTKTCYVYARDCEDPYGFLCIKDIPCYSDGCCKKETTYCLNTDTKEVEVCHEAFYLLGSCTTPVQNTPCVLELKPCTTTPDCPKG